MGIKNFTLTAGFFFLAIGLLHVTRIIYNWDAFLGEWSMPLWISGVAALFVFFLSFQAFKISGRS